MEPTITRELLEWLFETFGSVTENATTLEGLHFAKGQVSVLRKLEALHQKQCASQKPLAVSSEASSSTNSSGVQTSLTRPRPLLRPRSLRNQP